MADVPLAIALPNKGPLAASAQQLARDLGFRNGFGERKYSAESEDGKYRFLLARARDVPAYVESGKADLGITGGDVVAELNPNVLECMALPFGFCRLVYAVPKNGSLPPERVATSFPNLASAYLSSKKIGAQVVVLDGAVEASVSAGVVDAVIDLTSTGRTLEANNLREEDELMKSSAVLIANRVSLAEKWVSVKEVLALLRGDFTVRSGFLAGLAEDVRKKIFFRSRASAPEVAEIVREIFERVRKERDDALSYYAEKFDGVEFSSRNQFEVSAEEIKEAYSLVDGGVIAALKKSMENVARFSKKELPQRWEIKVEGGSLGKRIVALDSVGVYAPGGTAAYPSSVLMGVVPAKTAGVREVVLCTPCGKDKKCNPAVLVAADIAGTDRIFKLGGAQAIAAMAFGTRTVPKMAKIVGPGNVFVAAAKSEAVSRGLTAIDSPAGPSELLVIADETADAGFVAADLLAQAEHDANAAVVLLATSRKFVENVEKELRKQIMLLPRKQIARQSLSNNGALLVVSNVSEAIDFANEYAPEHLELLVERPFAWLDKVRNAGAVFLGNYSCEAAGDYAAGPNHVLPTGGAARAYSGLSARDFVREMNYLRLDKNGLAAMRDTITALADAEGFSAHVNSVKKRFDNEGTK